MSTIRYSIFGTYSPFRVELRNFKTNNLVECLIIKKSGTYSFSNIPEGEYIIIILDRIGGKEISKPFTVTNKNFSIANELLINQYIDVYNRENGFEVQWSGIFGGPQANKVRLERRSSLDTDVTLQPWVLLTLFEDFGVEEPNIYIDEDVLESHFYQWRVRREGTGGASEWIESHPYQYLAG